MHYFITSVINGHMEQHKLFLKWYQPWASNRTCMLLVCALYSLWMYKKFWCRLYMNFQYLNQIKRITMHTRNYKS